LTAFFVSSLGQAVIPLTFSMNATINFLLERNLADCEFSTNDRSIPYFVCLFCDPNSPLGLTDFSYQWTLIGDRCEDLGNLSCRKRTKNRIFRSHSKPIGFATESIDQCFGIATADLFPPGTIRSAPQAENNVSDNKQPECNLQQIRRAKSDSSICQLPGLATFHQNERSVRKWHFCVSALSKPMPVQSSFPHGFCQSRLRRHSFWDLVSAIPI
jgi:hypothetical protein